MQREWLLARRKEVIDATYRKLRDKYVIIVEAARPQVDVPPRPGNRADAAQRP